MTASKMKAQEVKKIYGMNKWKHAGVLYGEAWRWVELYAEYLLFQCCNYYRQEHYCVPKMKGEYKAHFVQLRRKGCNCLTVLSFQALKKDEL